MKHKVPNAHDTISTKHYPIRDELRDLAIKATTKLGGYAMIDDRYVIVDTTKFTVTPK
jgi:hypothetical protein